MEKISKSIEEHFNNSDLSFINEILSLNSTLSLNSSESLSMGATALIIEMQKLLENSQREILRLREEKQEISNQLEILTKENEELKQIKLASRRSSVGPEIPIVENHFIGNLLAPTKKITKKMGAIRSNQISNFLKFNS